MSGNCLSSDLHIYSKVYFSSKNLQGLQCIAIISLVTLNKKNDKRENNILKRIYEIKVIL